MTHKGCFAIDLSEKQRALFVQEMSYFYFMTNYTQGSHIAEYDGSQKGYSVHQNRFWIPEHIFNENHILEGATFEAAQMKNGEIIELVTAILLPYTGMYNIGNIKILSIHAMDTGKTTAVSDEMHAEDFLEKYRIMRPDESTIRGFVKQFQEVTTLSPCPLENGKFNPLFNVYSEARRDTVNDKDYNDKPKSVRLSINQSELIPDGYKFSHYEESKSAVFILQ